MRAGAEQADRLAQVERIIGEVIRQRNSGVWVDDTALEARHAHLMPELGRRLRTLRMIETAGRRAREHPRTASSARGGEQVADEGLSFLHDGLTDYELLERLRCGGQGVVYKAVQRSTNRIAAVKVLLHGPLATDRQRRRFAREVDLISRLRHPNIVTLYDSGEVRGLPYFAMAFIDGLPVDDYAFVHALTARDTVSLFGTICRGVHAAHLYGVIHRDLKPSNVLVDPDGVPHLLDFGLAKDTMPPDDSDEVSFASLPGQVVGTLPYLSPEQARGLGVEVEVRSDVYSLGVMLYELLTEELPYPVSGDAGAVRTNILYREPSSMRTALAQAGMDRRLRPRDVNGDLEAIVLKALEKEPVRRYQSAAALADDLDRWLAGDAVEAKAARRFYLLKKTLRRYRVHVAVSAAFVTLLAVALVGTTILWQRAERNARVYQAGLEMGMFSRLGGVERDAGRLDQAAVLLEKVIELGKSFPTSDPTIRRLRFHALYDLADLYYRSGELDKAGPFCRGALDLAKQLVRDDPQDAGYRRCFALSHSLGARKAASSGDWQLAAAEYERAASVYRSLVELDTDTTRLRYELGVFMGERGRCLQELGRFSEALRCYEEAHDLHQALVAAEPRVTDYTIELARTEAKLAVWHLHQKTAEHDDSAAAFLTRAKDRLIDLRDSGRVHGRERDVAVLLRQIEQNRQLLDRRRKTPAAASDHEP